MICDVRRDTLGSVGSALQKALYSAPAILYPGPTVVCGEGARVSVHILLDEVGRDVIVVVGHHSSESKPLPLGGFLRGHKLPLAKFGRPFERRIGPGVPHAL